MASSKPIRAKSAVVPSIRDAYGFEVKKDYLTLYHKYAPLWEKEEGERSQRWGTFLDLFGSSDEDHAGGSAQHQAALDKLEGALSIWRLTDRQARDTETPAWQQQLRSMVQAGVPMALRGRMWKIFLGLTGKKKEGVYDKLVTKALGKRQHRHQKRETGSKGPDVCRKMLFDAADNSAAAASPPAAAASHPPPVATCRHNPAAAKSHPAQPPDVPCAADDDKCVPCEHEPNSLALPGAMSAAVHRVTFAAPEPDTCPVSAMPALGGAGSSGAAESQASLPPCLSSSLAPATPPPALPPAQAAVELNNLLGRSLLQSPLSSSTAGADAERLSEASAAASDKSRASGASSQRSSSWHPSSRDWNLQIEKDLHRTFPGHPVMDGSGRNALRRILAAYSRRNASVGYCQGMNFVAGCLLLFMDEEDAFWCLTVIVEDLLPGYFSMAMVAPQVDQLVFKHMVDMRFPTLAQHLEDHGVNASSVSTQWFLCIFVNSLPLETCLRVWDMFFFESCASVLFRVALALVDIYSQALMATTDSVDAFSLLQNMAPMSYDSSRLIDVACIGFSSLSDTQLATLRAVYRTTVLAQFQDDVEEERWSDSEEEGAHLQPQRSSLSSPGGAALPALLPSAPGGSIDLEEGLQLVQRSQSASGPKRRRTKEVAELAGGSSLCSSPGGSGCSTPLSTSPASPWSLDSQDWHATPTWPDAHPHPPLSKLAAVLHPAADLAVPSAPADYSAALVGGEEAVEQGPSMDQAQYDAALRQTWELAARLPKIGVSAGAAKKQEGRQGLGQKVLARFHLPEMGLGDQLRTLMPGRKGSPAGLPISNAAPLKPDASRAAATLYEIASTPSPTRYAPQRLPPHTPAPSPADNARAATGPTGQADGAEAAGVLLPPATPQEHCVGSHYGAPATPENTPQAEGAAARARLGAATYVSLRAAASAATTVAEQDGLPALACHPLDLSEAGSNLSSSPRTAASSAYASPQKLVPHSLDAQLAAQGGETAPQPSLSRLRSHLAPAPGSPVLSGTSDPASASMAAVVVRSAADVEKGAGSGTVDDARAAGAKQQLLGLVEGLEEELFLAEARRHDAESQVSTLAADAAELAGRLEDARGLLEERRQTAALLDDKLRGVAGQLADTDCELAGRAAALDGARAHLALKHSLLGEKDTLIAQLNRQVAQVSGDSLGRALFRNLNLNRFRRSEKPAVPGSRRDDPASHSVTSPARHMQPS